MKIKHLSLLCALLLSSCQGSFLHEVTKGENSVEVEINERSISLEILDHGIIHVTKKIAGQEGYEVPNLVAVLEPQEVKWSM